MPEGHSLHRLAHAITDLFAGHRVRASSPQGRFSLGADAIDDQYLHPAQAWGKHLFIPFAQHAPEQVDGVFAEPDLADPSFQWVHIHLGLYGSWVFSGASTFTEATVIGAPRRRFQEGDDLVVTPHESWQAPEPRPTVRLRLELPDGIGDLTGPNQCELLTADEVETVLARLGPDPLHNDPGDRERFISSVRKRRSPVGQLVMDQSVAAGPGNIYRAECLFRVGISPHRPGNRVSAARLAALWDDLVLTMNDGVTSGVIWTVPEELALTPPPVDDPEAERFAVYHRTGRPCLRCGSPVKEAEMQGRRLFWCGRCQR